VDAVPAPRVEWNAGSSEAAYRSLLMLLFPQPRTPVASSSDGLAEGAGGGEVGLAAPLPPAAGRLDRP